MVDRINITKTEKIEIYEKFISGVTMRELSRQYPYSFTFIQKLIQSYEHEINLSKNYPQIDNHVLFATCKLTNKTFDDYSNKSGSITQHIKLTYPNLNLPSNYILKSIEYDTGRFWYDEYFEFNYKPIKEIFKCKLCDWSTEDINNESGAYEKHLKNIHKIDLSDYLKQFPNDRSYFKKEIYNELIECKVCGQKFKSITDTHLIKHNITPTEYKLKYGDVIISQQTKEKLRKIYPNALNGPNAHKFNKTSKLEDFIIENVNIKFQQSNRKILNGFEIDLIHEESKTCFEINGCLYHTEKYGKKDKYYHLTKTQKCNEIGYNLYHIFEDEIMLKPEIIISKINHILNISNNERIHARKCIITNEVNKEDKSVFLNKNHIQGSDNSLIQIIAKYNDNIVAMMCFDNKRQMNKEKIHDNNTYELTRFCVKNNYQITGIANRLLKYFIQNYKPNRIVSFADIRWTPNSNNNLYTNLGFNLVKILPPDYSYFKSSVSRYGRLHKFGFGKSNLKRKYPEIYDNSKTEWEMMQELGFDRIWDCGKYKYELIIK